MTSRQEPHRLGVRSFLHPLDDMAEHYESGSWLDLVPSFAGRSLAAGKFWHEDVFQPLRTFLLQQARRRRHVELRLDVHASLAFAAGYCLNTQSGLEISLVQRTQVGGWEIWQASRAETPAEPLWSEDRCEPLNEGASDVALALSVTHNVSADVRRFLSSSSTVGRLVSMTLHPAPSPAGLRDGAHALQLAHDAGRSIRQYGPGGARGVLHLFASAPNAVMFFLGQSGHMLGPITLYEFNPAARAYSAALTFPPPEE